jgi:hypothetical protein
LKTERFSSALKGTFDHYNASIVKIITLELAKYIKTIFSATLFKTQAYFNASVVVVNLEGVRLSQGQKTRYDF